LQIAIIGDIYHSRVTRSNCHLLSRFGAKITLVRPPEFVPEWPPTLAPGAARNPGILKRRCVAQIVIYAILRLQKERLCRPKDSAARTIFARYQMTAARVKLAQTRCDRDAFRGRLFAG